ncbi:hypothetical protein M5K25_016674 [Dendrobium thyrsiflorum]|uniref:Mechanosensitive ion channel MscS domain-containing protein n=1 Tax=Dendrobium thyrsiflorum TaxID=117978 RepID=A0ABD0UKR2_DENTH
MSRAKTVFQICLHAVNRHDSCTGSSQLHIHNMNISKFRWNCFQTASCLNEGKNQKAKTLTLHHSVEETAALFPFSFHEIKQRRNSFSKKNYSRSLNSRCLMKKELCLQHRFLPWGSQFSCRSYSSDASSKTDGLQNATPNDFAKETAEKITNSEWSDILNDAHQSVVGAVSYVGRRAKEVSDEVSPYMQQLYYSHPYLEKVIVPVGGTMAATLLAWFIMPRIFRKFHNYASRNPFALLSGGSIVEEISYEKSVWSALEDPARYLITFMAFYELGIIIAPTTAQYLPQAWRGAVVLSLLWFLHRWKTNVFTRAMEKPSAVGLDRDKLLTLEKISSMGLLVLGAIALAEACGVAVQSILTVGGIGGVATAFAARDILGNILSGLSLQFSKPFSLGDYIKAGSIEGQVVEMGLTTTCLMNPEKFPVIVPNSLFSSQVIVNKSRAQLRACMKNIAIQIDDLQKVPYVTEEIKSMLCSNPKVSLEKDTPYCFLSRIENSFLELTLGCNLKNMKKDELYATEQNILLQAATIIKKNGAKIGCNL